MKLRLVTDFPDYYDHHFDNDGERFYRKTNSGMDRKSMFSFFAEQNIATPLFGTVKELSQVLDPFSYIVVYTDLHSHQGENKKKICLFEATALGLSDMFASQYVKENKGVSYRYLRVGSLSFWIRYESKEWLSNVNTEKIEVITLDEHVKVISGEPLYAIDFVGNPWNLLAVDYNIAPKIKGTGVEDMLSASEVVRLLKEEIIQK